MDIFVPNEEEKKTETSTMGKNWVINKYVENDDSTQRSGRPLPNVPDDLFSLVQITYCTYRLVSPLSQLPLSRRHDSSSVCSNLLPGPLMLDSFTEKMSHHIKLNPTNSSYSALPFNSPRIDEGSSCPRMSEALPSYATKFNAIPRIHPIHLLSALLVGLLLSSGISYLNPSIHSAPLNVNQFRKNDYSIGPTNDVSLRSL